MVDRIDHIGIAVRSIDESRRFYESLGLSIEAEEEVESEGVRVAMIQVGESRIELLEAMTPDSPIARFIDRQGPGIHHLCLKTSDIHGAEEQLRAGGAKLLRDAPSQGAGGCWVQFVHPKSSGGVLIELSQDGPATGDDRA